MGNAQFAGLILGALCLFGVVGAGLTVAIGLARNPPRPARWVPNPYPGRSPYWDPGRSWSDLLSRAALVGIATALFVLPGVLLLGFGGAAGGRQRR